MTVLRLANILAVGKSFDLPPVGMVVGFEKISKTTTIRITNGLKSLQNLIIGVFYREWPSVQPFQWIPPRYIIIPTLPIV